ncbi:hypothetical protein [Methylobacterium sp. CM6247]
MEWLDPWESVNSGQTDDVSALGQGWEAELRKEVAPAHIFYGLAITLIARRYDRDDALFQLHDGRVAQVHLTWKQAQEPDPRWPKTVIYASLQSWADTDQRCDHAAWVAAPDP